ncbi:major capsid protein [Escherichia coli]|nr:major capsid protein [Escherichia coli]
MAVDIKDVEQIAQELQQKFDDFKVKNDKRVDAIEQEKGKLAGQVETLNGKLSELENLKSDLEKELLELKRPAGGAQINWPPSIKRRLWASCVKAVKTVCAIWSVRHCRWGTDEDGGYAVPEETGSQHS